MSDIPVLGGIPDPHDPRDYVKAGLPGDLDDRVDLSAFGRQAAWYQGRVGSCTGFSASAFIRTLYGRLHPGSGWDPAPLFLYWHARQLYGTLDQDSGAPLRDMMKVLQQVGVSPLELHPTLDDWRLAPSKDANEAASLLKIHEYQRIMVGPDAPDTMMRCLCHERLPLLIAVQLFNHVNSGEAQRTGALRLPTPGEGLVGVHAMMLDGYDRATERFHGWNSWGRTWGKSGRFSLPFEYFTRFDCAFDIWTFSFKYW